MRPIFKIGDEVHFLVRHSTRHGIVCKIAEHFGGIYKYFIEMECGETIMLTENKMFYTLEELTDHYT